MIVNPVVENDYYDAFKSLEHGKNKYIAHGTFRFAPSPQEKLQVRPRHRLIVFLQDAIKRNAYLDTSPTKLHTGKCMEQLMDLRPRQKDKELGDGMIRYQPKTRIEQVYDALSGRTSIVIASRDIISTDKKQRRHVRGHSVMSMTATKPFTSNSSLASSPKRAHSPMKVLPDIVNSMHPTGLIPTLHQKTHFKAATSVFINHKGSLNHRTSGEDETGK